jgi:hypothetical protein
MMDTERTYLRYLEELEHRQADRIRHQTTVATPVTDSPVSDNPEIGFVSQNPATPPETSPLHSRCLSPLPVCDGTETHGIANQPEPPYVAPGPLPISITKKPAEVATAPVSTPPIAIEPTDAAAPEASPPATLSPLDAATPETAPFPAPSLPNCATPLPAPPIANEPTDGASPETTSLPAPARPSSAPPETASFARLASPMTPLHHAQSLPDPPICGANETK